jgi:hypothetical protein
MNQPLQSIVQHLFQANSLEDVTLQRLESFVEEYPSFGIGHYLLSQKLRTEDPERYREVTQRTCLYFSNPFWLQWQLANGDSPHQLLQEAVSPVHPGLHESTLPAGTAPGTDIGPSGTPVPNGTNEETIEDEEPSVTSPAINEEPAGSSALFATDSPEATAMDSPEATVTASPEATATDAPEATAADQLLRSIEEAKGLRESLQRINEDFTTDPTGQEQPIHDEETPFVLDEPEEHAAAGHEQPETPAPAPTNMTPPAPEQPVDMPPRVPEPSPSLPAPEPPPASPAPELVFEPFHTIDYFASQGIRLTIDENPGDALGKQLKSFTDWLKVMRRLPQKDRETAVPDRVAEQAVQDFAAHSIQSKDILTETMAEVLIKQGMRDRARAIYEKLSLLNPDKKAYFAAKIEQLNIP